jgi:hypothetical protein
MLIQMLLLYELNHLFEKLNVVAIGHITVLKPWNVVLKIKRQVVMYVPGLKCDLLKKFQLESARNRLC